MEDWLEIGLTLMWMTFLVSLLLFVFAEGSKGLLKSIKIIGNIEKKLGYKSFKPMSLQNTSGRLVL